MGSSDIAEDAKIITAAIKSAKGVGLKKAMMLINNRKYLMDIPIEVIRSIDKLNKIGISEVEKEVAAKGFTKEKLYDFLNKLTFLEEKAAKGSPPVELMLLYIELKKEGLKEGVDFRFDAKLARGLDYYNGSVFELKESDNPSALSLGGGGRYDNLIGMFAKRQIPAVGFSFGIDRLIEAMP